MTGLHIHQIQSRLGLIQLLHATAGNGEYLAADPAGGWGA